MDIVMNILSVVGIGAIFLIGIIVGGMMVVSCIKKIFGWLFK